MVTDEMVAMVNRTMVKRVCMPWILLLAGLAGFLVPARLTAQTTGSSVTVLYHLEIDEDFYFLARAAGVQVWDDYFGPFPEREFWYYSLESVLGNTEGIAQVLHSSDDADLIAQAISGGIPVVVKIQITGDIAVPYAQVHYSIREIFSKLHVVENSFQENIPLEADLLSYFWLPLASDLNAFIETIIIPRFQIQGPAGTLVHGFSREPLTIPDTESLFLDVPMPGTYRWEMIHKRYTRRQGVFMADKDRTLLILPRQRFYPTSIDMGLFLGRFPELWVSRYLKSYGWFFSIGIQQQTFGLLLTDRDAPLKTSFNQRPLLMPGIGAGYRFRGPEPYIPKPYIAGTLFLRTNYENTSFDDFSPVSTMVTLGYEWETPLRLKFFFELGASFYVLGRNYEGSRSKGTEDSGFVQAVLGDAMYLELPTFRMGIKVLLPF
ncbi:MAG: hypothetical protein LBT14_10085 [Treponema sp.]|jgi:hypothetical protein|nr:hypothetical protein [Treponema sp.]